MHAEKKHEMRKNKFLTLAACLFIIATNYYKYVPLKDGR